MTQALLPGIAACALAGGPQDPFVSLVEQVGSVFDPASAMRTIAFADGFFRVRANDGYEAVLDHVAERLREAGFGAEGDFLAYEFRTEDRRPAWTPRRARLALVEPEERVLHEFENRGDRDRVAICIHSFSTPPGGVVAELVDAGRRWDDSLSGRNLAGKIVLGDANPTFLFQKAVVEGGAAGVLSASIAAYNRAEEFPDSIQFGSIPHDEKRKAFGFKVSRRTRDALRARLAEGARVMLRADVESRFDRRPLRSLVAEIAGRERPDEFVAVVAHVQEPGANDNASGVGSILEMALAWKRGIEAGTLPRPKRPVVFLWGEEMESTRLLLDRERRAPFAGLVLDMVGEKTAVTGGPFRLERMPDPGAVWTRPPDEHSGWGKRPVDRARLRGHFLNELFRAFLDARGRVEPWEVAENPFEGGSDHEVLLDRGVPAVLAWHFPDFTYHTSLDRLDVVDPAEVGRVGTASLAAAVALAAADETLLEALAERVAARAEERLRAAIEHARRLVEAADESARAEVRAREREILEAWSKWFDETIASVSKLAPAPEALAGNETFARARARVLRAGREALSALEPAPVR